MYGARKPRWGWHRLTDSHAAELVRRAGVCENDLVFDLGAGEGAITAHLAATGARVIAVELHDGRARKLSSRFDAHDNVKIVQADCLDLWLPSRPFKVVANPPFGITTDLLHLLLRPGSGLISAHIVLQRAAAKKVVAKPLNRDFALRLAYNLPRSAFYPEPKVDIGVLAANRIFKRR